MMPFVANKCDKWSMIVGIFGALFNSGLSSEWFVFCLVVVRVVLCYDIEAMEYILTRLSGDFRASKAQMERNKNIT